MSRLKGGGAGSGRVQAQLLHPRAAASRDATTISMNLMSCHAILPCCHAPCNDFLTVLQGHLPDKLMATNGFIYCHASMKRRCVAWALPWHRQLQLQGWCRQGKRQRWKYRNNAPAASGCSSHCATPTPAAVPGMHTRAQSSPQLC